MRDDLKNKALFSAKDIQKYLGVGQNNAYKIMNSLPTVYCGGKKVKKTDLDKKFGIESNL